MSKPINFNVVLEVKQRFFESDENECWPWLGSFDSRGIPRIKVDKEYYKARTVIVLYSLGLVQTDKELIYTCGNKSCMNYKNHLKLGTQQEVIQEAIKRGTHGSLNHEGENHPYARLNKNIVIEIRKLFWKDGYSNKDLCLKFNLDHSHVSHILSRKLWNSINDGYPAYYEQIKSLPNPDPIILPPRYIETEIKQIRLIDGSCTYVSEIDYLPLLAISTEWKISEKGMIYNQKEYTQRMYDLIGKWMGINYLDVIDHIDRNVRNNIRSNLRPATHGQSNFNRNYSNSAEYRGVIKNGSGFTATIGYKNKKLHLGTYPSENEAKEIYIKYAKLYYGEFFDETLHG